MESRHTQRTDVVFFVFFFFVWNSRPTVHLIASLTCGPSGKDNVGCPPSLNGWACLVQQSWILNSGIEVWDGVFFLFMTPNRAWRCYLFLSYCLGTILSLFIFHLIHFSCCHYGQNGLNTEIIHHFMREIRILLCTNRHFLLPTYCMGKEGVGETTQRGYFRGDKVCHNFSFLFLQEN